MRIRTFSSIKPIALSNIRTLTIISQYHLIPNPCQKAPVVPRFCFQPRSSQSPYIAFGCGVCSLFLFSAEQPRPHAHPLSSHDFGSLTSLGQLCYGTLSTLNLSDSCNFFSFLKELYCDIIHMAHSSPI